MRAKSCKLALIIGAVTILHAGWAGAFPPRRPYDPRPLMAAVDDRAKQGRFRFIVFGDSKNNPPFADVLKQAAGLKPDFVLSTGDLVDRGAGPRGATEYDRLAEMAGPFLRRVPTWPVNGNHELNGGEAAVARENAHRFFGLTDGNYFFDVGPARFIGLEWPAPNAAARVWLERRLSEARGRLIFVFQHNLYYTVGSKTQVKNAPDATTRLFTKYRVTAVFQGHDHGYYRTRRDAVWYITSAGAGAEIYRLNRFREARPGDVFYGQLPMDGGPVSADKYWLHDAEGRDRTFDSPRHFLVAVDVDDGRVTARALTTRGETLDSLELKGPGPTRSAPAISRRAAVDRR